MKVLSGILLAITVIATTASSAVAQSTAPKVTIAHDGADKVLSDLESILKLTPAKQQKQWDVIKKFMGAFLDGVDKSKPLRMDLIIPNAGPIQYQPCIPIAPGDINKFRNLNLKPAGIDTRRIQASLYKCKGQVYQGYLRYRFNYAIFGEKKNDVPLDIANPLNDIKALLAAYDAGMIGRNTATDAKSIAARRAWVQKQWKELAAALKKADGESDSDFAFRKSMFELQMAEAERFYAESKNLTMGWTLNPATMQGRGDLTMEAIPGTTLYNSIKMLGVKPSHFANIPNRKDSILSVRINHPLDKQRTDSLIAIFNAIRDRTADKSKADKTRTSEEIAASVKVINAIAKILAENADKGLFDAYLDIHPNAAKKHTAVMGFRTVDGRPAADILKLLPAANKNHAVKMDVAKVGNVSIHQVTFDFGKESLMSTLLGGQNLLIGVSKETLWLAGGADAMKELESAIKLTATPAVAKPGDPFVQMLVRFGPWVEAMAVAKPNSANPELRKAAQAAFTTGKDAMLIEMRRDQDKILGRMDIQIDLMRFAGGMIAKFSEETLDDSSEAYKKKKAAAKAKASN